MADLNYSHLHLLKATTVKLFLFEYSPALNNKTTKSQYDYHQKNTLSRFGICHIAQP